MENNKYWQECGELGTLVHLLVGMENHATAVENSLALPRKFKLRIFVSPSHSTSKYMINKNAKQNVF